MNLQQPSFGGGEYAPALYGRQDLARYQISGRQIENFIVRPTGGMDRRTGTNLCGEVKDSTKVVTLIPFDVGDGVSYVIELGDFYARFIYRGSYVIAATSVAYDAAKTYALGEYVSVSGITYRSLQAANVAHTPASSPTWWQASPLLELITPWSQSQIFDVRFTQSADTLYLTHIAIKQRTIKRTESSMFTISEYVNREGPFRSLNSNEAYLLTASAATGTVTITSNFDVFNASMVGGLIYLEPASLGNIKPWVQGERTPNLAVGVFRRSDGKVYKATTVAAATAPNYTETGNVRPTHDKGREWDGPGDGRVSTVNYTVGVEWEYQHSGYGVAEITGYTDARTVTAVVKKTMPPEVVGGIGAATNTWTKSGTGVALTFTGLTGATSTNMDNYTVQISGVPIPSDPNSSGGGSGGDDGEYTPCVSVNALLLVKVDGEWRVKRAGDVKVGDILLCCDPYTLIEHEGLVTYSQERIADMVRVYLANCATLPCSTSAPIPVAPNGELVLAPDLRGHATLLRNDGGLAMHEVVEVESIGIGAVQHITCENACFYASEDGEQFLLHHNAKPGP